MFRWNALLARLSHTDGPLDTNRPSPLPFPMMFAIQTKLPRIASVLALTGLMILPASALAQSKNDLGKHLVALQQLAQEALSHSKAAETSASVDEVKQHTDQVFALIWGAPSGLVDAEAGGAAHIHGWKVRWQVNNDEFDEGFAERYGTEPPAITDPMALGIIGQGRAVRKQLNASGEANAHIDHTVISLNNVIGWMKIDDGVTKGERQPRVDLTSEWDAPSEFWLSTADTGWMFEVFSQAMNILKTSYEGDLGEAQKHAAGMTQLLEKCLNGEDANGNGSIEPVKMEGGLNSMLEHAEYAGLASS